MRWCGTLTTTVLRYGMGEVPQACWGGMGSGAPAGPCPQGGLPSLSCGAGMVAVCHQELCPLTPCAGRGLQHMGCPGGLCSSPGCAGKPPSVPRAMEEVVGDRGDPPGAAAARIMRRQCVGWSGARQTAVTPPAARYATWRTWTHWGSTRASPSWWHPARPLTTPSTSCCGAQL